MEDKHNIPKSKMHSNCRLLPDHIVCKMTQRNNIRRANTCDPALKLLNEEITSGIQKHKQNLWKEHLDEHWDQRHNTHIIWKTIHGLSNRAPPFTHTIRHLHLRLTTTPVHRFRSWPMQMTSQSHPHTQVRVQPRNTYNHTYTKFLPGQNKTTSY